MHEHGHHNRCDDTIQSHCKRRECAGRLAETLRGLELPDERIALTAAFASIVPQPAVQEGEQPGGETVPG